MSTPFSRSMRYLATFSARMEVAMTTATQRNVALAETTVRMHLRNQDLGWKGLSPAYADRKARTGAGRRSYFRGSRRGKTIPRGGGSRLSEKTLIATGTYLGSITSEVTGMHEGAVGVLRSSRYADGERIANIAAVHEFGSKDGKIPKRPLWAPSAEEISEECKGNWINAMRGTVRFG